MLVVSCILDAVETDQVATDMHLYTKKQVQDIIALIKSLQSVIVDIASNNVDTIMPGYTHLQRAQPISFAHHIMTYFLDVTTRPTTI